MTPRFPRRLVLLRAKREGTFDPHQTYLGTARRARVARKLAVHLRRGDACLLATPMWSDPGAFLDDLRLDCTLGAPALAVDLLDLGAIGIRNAPQVWRPLVEHLSAVCEVRLSEQARAELGRSEFVPVVRSILRSRGPARALVLAGIEVLPPDVLRDWVRLADEPDTGASLLLAGAVDPSQLEGDRVVRATLADYGPHEALEALVERVGVRDLDRLRWLAAWSGGIPAVLRAVASAFAARATEALGDQQVMRWLGELGADLRRAVQDAAYDPLLRRRLADLADGAPRPADPDLDGVLALSGLVRSDGAHSQLRAPFLGQLA